MMGARHQTETTAPVSLQANAAAEEEWPVALVPADSGSVAFVSWILCFFFFKVPHIIISKKIVEVAYTCGQTASQNNSYFSNANYPSSYDATGSCQLQINKVSSDICQLKYSQYL